MFDSCVCVDVDDYVTMLDERIRKARKEHVCDECHEKIPPGTKYEFMRFIDDGEFFQHKTCLPCMNVRKSLFHCGFHFGMLWEDLRDHFGNEYGYEDEDGEDDDFKWLKG